MADKSVAESIMAKILIIISFDSTFFLLEITLPLSPEKGGEFPAGKASDCSESLRSMQSFQKSRASSASLDRQTKFLKTSRFKHFVTNFVFDSEIDIC